MAAVHATRHPRAAACAGVRLGRRACVLLAGLACVSLAACSAPPRGPTPESRWIADHAVPVRSIDPSDRTFDDLAPLAGAIGEARIVLLGEQSHGEGSTFLAKTRLIEFLHEQMGFDVLAMESGLFACERAGDAILAGRPAREMVEASVFDVWTGSTEFAPLIGYLDRTRSSGHPLELAGFDMQLTGSLSRDRLVPELKAAIGESPETRSAAATIATMTTSMSRFGKIGKPAQERFYADAVRAMAVLDRRTDPDGRFLRQVLRSTVQSARFFWNADFDKPVPAVMNIRDAQMADNLLWLARERYPGRRIIVWAATSHASRNRQSIQPPIADAGMVPMGHHLWQALGERIYVVGFTSARGRFGSWRGSPTDLAPPRAGSLEDAFERTGREYLFLDLRGSVGSGDWLASPVLARPMGHARMVARWRNIMDAVFYIRTATPSTGLE